MRMANNGTVVDGVDVVIVVVVVVVFLFPGGNKKRVLFPPGNKKLTMDM